MNRNDIYNHAYLVLNICMVVKIKYLVWTRSEKYWEIRMEFSTLLISQNWASPDLPGNSWNERRYSAGIQRGLYQVELADRWNGQFTSSLQKSHLFAWNGALSVRNDRSTLPFIIQQLYLHGTMRPSLKTEGAKVKFVNRNVYALGLSTGKSLLVNEIITFDLERTICKVLRNRNQIDTQILNEAWKGMSFFQTEN